MSLLVTCALALAVDSYSIPGPYDLPGVARNIARDHRTYMEIHDPHIRLSSDMTSTRVHPISFRIVRTGDQGDPAQTVHPARTRPPQARQRACDQERLHQQKTEAQHACKPGRDIDRLAPGQKRAEAGQGQWPQHSEA